MKSNWKEERLGSLVRFSSGGTPNKNNPSYWNGTIPWISAKNMKSEVIETSDLSITEEGLIHGSKIAPKGSLLLLVRGSGLFNGIPVCYLENAVAYNQDVKCIESTSELENKYLFYWLKANSGYLRKKIEFTSIGAGKFDTRFLSNLVVRFPDKVTRKKIIDIADNISDRININRKINENLLQQLHQMYLHILGTSDMDILLGSVINTTSGGTPSRKHDEYYSDGSICWVKSKELLSGYIHDTEEHINELAVEKSSAKLLPTHSVLIAMYGATVGAYGIIAKPMTCNQAVCALLSNEKYPYTYLFQLACESQQKLINLAVGSAQQNISQVLIKQLPIHQNLEAIHHFHSLAKPMHEEIESLQAENAKLAAIRDSLLPKLMSGELDVSALDL